MMVGKKFLIVNADDFGMSAGVNRGIIKTHEHGILTSARLLVRWPAAAEAASYSQRHPNLSLGLHVDLGEWVFQRATWSPIYQRVNLKDAKAIEKEMTDQLIIFFRLFGKAPTHLDSHQHIHRQEPVRSLLMRLAHKIGIPLRGYNKTIQFCGKFYGQTAQGDPLPGVLSVRSLLAILKSLPYGYTELSCHPGEANDVETSYRAERLQEVKILCHPQIRKALPALDIHLSSFNAIDA